MIGQYPYSLTCKIITAIAWFSIVPLHLTFSPNAALACKLLNMTVWAVFDIVLRILQFAPRPYELVYFLQDFGICRQLLEIGARSWALFCVSVN